MKRILHFIPLVVIGVLSAFAPAHAATFNVSSLKDDGGANELRWAITKANATPSSTITFTSGLSGAITLSSDLPSITADTTIMGPGASVIAVDGNNTYRPFTLDAASKLIKISGITVRHGDGGAIMVLGGVLSLLGCTLSDNSANGGGAINCNGYTVTLTNCTLTGNNGNTAYGGGAIYDFTGNVTLVNCTLSGNTLSGGASGGAIRNDSGTVTLTHCTLSENSTVDGGGNAIANYSGNIVLTDCMLSGNKTTSGNGGAILNSAGTATISNCVLMQNNANDGGAIVNDSTLTVTNSTLTGNNARSNGGGLFNIGGSATLKNCIVYGDSTISGTEITGSVPPLASYSDIEGGYPGAGNINADPLFAHQPLDLHLQPGSPCRSKGTAAGATITSIDGKTRPNPPSIGAYEVEPTVTITASPNPSYPGQRVTFTATVAAAPSIPTGSVTFAIGGLRPVVALNHGMAAYSLTSSTAGTIPAAVVYSGDTNFAPSTSATIQQTIYGKPTNVKIAPMAGPLTGGTTVTVYGTQFGPHPTVMFGTTPATSVVIVNATSLTCKSPKGTVGNVDVTVTNPAGTSATSLADQFTYMAVPTVTQVSPAAGPIAGSGVIIIRGSGFVQGSTVKFGTVSATNISVGSFEYITCKLPPGAAGVVDVRVTTPGGISTPVLADKFIYYAPPTITSFTPTSGKAGATITITGTNLSGTTSVTFLNHKPAMFKVLSAATITATIPAGAAPGPITIVTPGGSIASTQSFTPAAP